MIRSFASVAVTLMAMTIAAGPSACSSSTTSVGSAADAGGTPPAANSVTFTMKQTIPGSTEAFRCQYFKMPSDKTFATKVAHTYTVGSHHILLYRTDQTTLPAGSDQAQDCYANGQDFMGHVRGVVYGSQVPKDEFDLPAGVAFYMNTDEVLLLQTHYLNAQASSVDAEADVTLTLSDGASVSQKAGALFFYDPMIDVPAGGKSQSQMRCPIRNDITLLRAIPHTHARATAVTAYLDPATGPMAAQPFYVSTDWEHPAPMPTPIQVPAGSKIRFTCDYDNTTGTQEYFQGLSATTNEMCLFAGIYYPDMGLQDDYCFQGVDRLGTGTKTCGDIINCRLACPTGVDTSQNFGVDPCVQKCFVESCPTATADYMPVGACAKANCATECASGGGSACTTCATSKCAAEISACQSAVCGP